MKLVEHTVDNRSIRKKGSSFAVAFIINKETIFDEIYCQKKELNELASINDIFYWLKQHQTIQKKLRINNR